MTVELRVKLSFWSLNPGVVFRLVTMKAKAVILTSGTLSPTQTFASELQADFKYILEANHVIEPSQANSFLMGGLGGQHS